MKSLPSKFDWVSPCQLNSGAFNRDRWPSVVEEQIECLHQIAERYGNRAKVFIDCGNESNFCIHVTSQKEIEVGEEKKRLKIKNRISALKKLNKEELEAVRYG